MKYIDLDIFLLVFKGTNIFECLLYARELCWSLSLIVSCNPDKITFDRWCLKIESVGLALDY